MGIGNSVPGELLSLGLAGTTKGVLSLAGDMSGKVIIQPASVAGTWTLTLPASGGSSGQFLQTNGSGVSSWQTINAHASRSLRIVGIGDSHTEGSITTYVASTNDSIGTFGLFTPKDEQWNASGAVNSVFNDNNSINTTTGATDPNIGRTVNKGSYISRIPFILRSAYGYLDRIRIANLGVGGSSSYTWAGEMAGGYVTGTLANANDGDTVRVGSVTYTFRNSPSVANEVQIAASAGATLTNLGNAINAHGSGFAAGTSVNPDCWVSNPSITTYFHIFAKSVGTAGNSLSLQSNNSTRLAVVTAGLTPTTSSVNLYGGSGTSALYANGKALLTAGAGFGDPDAFVITLGTNDSTRFNDVGNVPDFASNLQILVTNLRTDYPNAKIILWHPIVTSVPTKNSYISSVINPAVDAIAAADPDHVSSIDAYGLGTGSAPTVILAPSDGVHATTYGYQMIAQLFSKKIAEVLGL